MKIIMLIACLAIGTQAIAQTSPKSKPQLQQKDKDMLAVMRVYAGPMSLTKGADIQTSCKNLQKNLRGDDAFNVSDAKLIMPTVDAIKRSTSAPDNKVTDISAVAFLRYLNSSKTDSLCLARNSNYYLYNGKAMQFPDNTVPHWVDSLYKDLSGRRSVQKK